MPDAWGGVRLDGISHLTPKTRNPSRDDWSDPTNLIMLIISLATIFLVIMTALLVIFRAPRLSHKTRVACASTLCIMVPAGILDLVYRYDYARKFAASDRVAVDHTSQCGFSHDHFALHGTAQDICVPRRVLYQDWRHSDADCMDHLVLCLPLAADLSSGDPGNVHWVSGQ